ncbi:MAG: GNAT family N-acetyltransferase [Chloroflexi bacterium]|nr:MAG: GNAT family N-acetyltransferase [Chloroflexota bacterium]
MVITVPSQAKVHGHGGVRPIRLRQDAPQVLELLRLAFGEVVDDEGRRILGGEGGIPSPLLWRLNPLATHLGMGYVWEENGRIIGNATILTTRLFGRYLVVNVAVHPDFRRQGIARALMHAVINHVHAQQGHEILLQVVKENLPAVRLYESLHFETLGHMTTWLASVSRLRAVANPIDKLVDVRELRPSEWRAAFQLDRLALSADLDWPEPKLPEMYRQGIWQRFLNFLNSRQTETWVTTDEHGRLTGLAHIQAEWGRAHELRIRVHPDWQGVVERPLLAKAIRRLRQLSPRNIRIEHPEHDQITNQLLQEANFYPRRTLTHMRLALTK